MSRNSFFEMTIWFDFTRFSFYFKKPRDVVFFICIKKVQILVFVFTVYFEILLEIIVLVFYVT